MALTPAAAGGERLRTSLSGFFTSTVTILRATEAQDAHGEPVLTWAVLAGHCDIKALVAAGDASALRLKRQEFRTAQNVHDTVYKRVLMSGVYPTMTTTDRARIDGYDWAIISIVTDVADTVTELLVESIEPGDI